MFLNYTIDHCTSSMDTYIFLLKPEQLFIGQCSYHNISNISFYTVSDYNDIERILSPAHLVAIFKVKPKPAFVVNASGQLTLNN